MGVLRQRILEESRKMPVVSSPVRRRRRADVTPETPDINIFTFPAALRAVLRDLPSNTIVSDKSAREDLWIKRENVLLPSSFALNSQTSLENFI